MDQCRLAGRVSDAAASRSDSGERSDIYDATRFVPLKLSGKTSREQKRPTKVCFEDAIPNLRRQCIEFAEWDANVPTCIVNQNVDPPKMANHVSHAFIDRMRVSLVKLYGVAAPTSFPHRFDNLVSARRFPYIGIQ